MKDDYLERMLPVGATRVVSGRVEHFNNQVQITHPDHILDPAAPEEMKPIEPVYRLTAGLSLRVVQKAVECRARPRARSAGMVRCRIPPAQCLAVLA